MGKQIGDYYLGLDIGTSSLGWAVTDPGYNILEYRRKALWGIHLFDEGDTAKERRAHRCARRRLDRRKQRITLLRELFSEEICKVDPAFFERLDESGLHMEDRKANQPNSLFNDPDFNDAEFHDRYPTVYHLRKELMETKTKPDIRLVYLALHHIIKYRGHFLFETSTEGGDMPSFREIVDGLMEDVQKYDMTLSISDYDALERTMTDGKLGISEKKKLIEGQLGCNEDSEKKLAHLLAGAKVNIKDLFSDSDVEESIKLGDAGADDRMTELENLLDTDQFNTLRIAKSIYDWGLMQTILGGCNYLSESMIKAYEQHRDDLALLKGAVRKYCPDKYGAMFKSAAKISDKEGNYCAYSGVCGKKKPEKYCNQDMFCAYCKKVFKDTGAADDPELKDMFERIELGTFMPVQRSSRNSVFPHTIHLKELKAIVDNVSKFYPFLTVKDKDGFAPADKIEMIQKFRVPYYCGPLNPQSPRGWAVRRSNEAITPWNFSSVVDEDETAQKFMDNLINFCQYLVGEPVLPKHSIVYSYFSLYNELNNLRIDGDPLSIDLKKDMIRDLFVGSNKKVTESKIRDYLVQRGKVDKKDKATISITGINGDIKTVLKSEYELSRIIGDRVNDRVLSEDIIHTIAVFGEPKRIKQKLTADHSDELIKDEIAKLSKLKLDGWGRLSYKFLTGLYEVCPQTGQRLNIMGMLENTHMNLMQILEIGSFKAQIENLNRELTHDDNINYSTVEKMPMSPAVRRAVWRTICVVEDVTSAIGHAPKKVFVETTRGHEPDKKTPPSRKKQLMELYKSCKEDEEWIKSLDSKDDAELKGQNLYLYYTQLGKCMYCGRKISIEDLSNKEMVDRDHIYPQSKVKDDSIHNNMVLCCRTCNADKSNTFPVPPEWQQRMKPFWDELVRKNYITKEKYSRLRRTEEFTVDELAKFISRQLVETSQSAKSTIKVLKRMFGDSTEIVYAKAKPVSEFRNMRDAEGNPYPELIKCRSVNDYHHAKDAYLNIVVGNVYDTKFTKNYRGFAERGEKYNLAKMYERDVERDGIIAWIPRTENGMGSMGVVLKNMRRNNILFTKYQYINKGALFDDQLLRAGDDVSALIPKKKGMDPSKYGGYNKPSGSFFALVQYNDGKKSVRSLEYVPVHELGGKDEDARITDMISKRVGSDVTILKSPIRFNALLDWGGARLHITGRTGDRIIACNGQQLLMDDVHYGYCKRIFTLVTDKGNRITHSAEYYKIDVSSNVDLFDYLLSKATMEPYSLLPSADALVNNLSKGREKFVGLDAISQAVVLNEILHTYQCNPTGSNIKEIGGSAAAGINTVSKKLPKRDDKAVAIINQSPSGLFEYREELN